MGCVSPGPERFGSARDNRGIRTMQRRKLLAGMGSLAAGGAAVFGSSAADSIRTRRHFAVDVTGDDNAYLALDAYHSEFVYKDDADVIGFDFSGNSNQGSGGVNNDAVTAARPGLELQNLTSRTLYVEVWNPFRNSDLSSSQNNTRAPANGGGSVEIPAGLDVQFIAVKSGTANDIDRSGGGGPGPGAALIDRETPPDSSAGTTFDIPANCYIDGDPSNQLEHSGSAVNLGKHDRVGHIDLDPGEAVDVIVRVCADGLDDYSGLPETGPVYFEANSDQNNMSTTAADGTQLI